MSISLLPSSPITRGDPPVCYPMTVWVTTNSCSVSYLPSHLLPVLNAGLTLSYMAALRVIFCSFLIWRASQDLLCCMSSQMLLGVLVMYGVHTKCSYPITDSTAEEKNRSISFHIGVTGPALTLCNARSVQCSAHLLYTHLSSMHLRRTHALFCGLKNIGTRVRPSAPKSPLTFTSYYLG